jgi:hypothetical protein
VRRRHNRWQPKLLQSSKTTTSGNNAGAARGFHAGETATLSQLAGMYPCKANIHAKSVRAKREISTDLLRMMAPNPQAIEAVRPVASYRNHSPNVRRASRPRSGP